MKKKIIIIIGVILILAIIIIVSLYIANKPARDWMDKYILRKNIIEENLQQLH